MLHSCMTVKLAHMHVSTYYTRKHVYIHGLKLLKSGKNFFIEHCNIEMTLTKKFGIKLAMVTSYKDKINIGVNTDQHSITVISVSAH